MLDSSSTIKTFDIDFLRGQASTREQRNYETQRDSEGRAGGRVKRQESDGLRSHKEWRQREIVIIVVNNDSLIEKACRWLFSNRLRRERGRREEGEAARLPTCQGLSHALSICQTEGRSVPCAFH